MQNIYLFITIYYMIITLYYYSTWKLWRLSCLRFLTISNLTRLCKPFKILNSLFTSPNSDSCSYKNLVILFIDFSASFKLTFSNIGIDSFLYVGISSSLSAFNIILIISSSVSAPSAVSFSILMYSFALSWSFPGRRAINLSSSSSASSSSSSLKLKKR